MTIGVPYEQVIQGGPAAAEMANKGRKENGKGDYGEGVVAE